MDSVNTAVILAGGKGTRLQSVTCDRVAKPAVLVDGRPFVDYIIEQLTTDKISRVILSLGHRADTVLENLRLYGKSSCRLDTYIEDTPLGTAGPLLRLRKRLPERFFVVNGDTFVEGISFSDMDRFHVINKSVLTIGLIRIEDISDYGTVKVDGRGKIETFSEKADMGRGLVNCGIYLINRSVIDSIPTTQSFSMERELIPSLLAKGMNVYGFELRGHFYDVGTPKRLDEFKRFLCEKQGSPN